MDGKIDLFTLLTLVVAVVLVLKLRSILGRKTGDEEQRLERNRIEQARRQQAAQQSGSDKVVTLPRRDREEAKAGAAGAPGGASSVAEAEARIKSFAGADSHVAAGLLEVLKFDESFDPQSFIRGAKQAYEMIVTAFAEGNRKMLKDLLSREVYDGFIGAIGEREARGEQIDQSFVGINKADIIDAEMKGGTASVSVRFVSQLISATRDKRGEVIGGDPQKIKEVTDIWTFSRDISSARARANPNWKLVATQAPN